MSLNLLGTVDEAVRAILARGRPAPLVGLVLGSGWGEFADSVENAAAIPYPEIPGFPSPAVPGHAGRLILGQIDHTPVAVLQGRFHFYEGHDLTTTTLPVRVLARLGVQKLILTAATGGIRSDLQPGDFLCISDHLNLMGANPLRGPHCEELGARFPDMSQVYSPHLRKMALQAAERLGLIMSEGVYAALPGPSYETPAEIRMLRTLGADVVGMSTVPEAIVARQMGLEVLGLALVSNAAAGVTDQPIDHAEVLAAGNAAAGRMNGLLNLIVKNMMTRSAISEL